MLLALFIPNSMTLDAHGLRELSKWLHEALHRCNDLFAFHTAIIDLILSWLPLLEDTRHYRLTNNALAKIIHYNCPRREEPVDIQLVDSLDPLDVLPCSDSCGFITTV